MADNENRVIAHSGTETLRAIMSAKRQADAAEDAKVIAILQQATFPTPPEVRRIFDLRVGVDRQRLLVHHAFDKERRLREGLEALVNAANAAHTDLRRHDAALTAIARQHQAFDGRISHVIENPVQKDLMAFCVAGLATVDVTRRLEKARPDLAEAMKAIVTSTFANDVSEFVKKLRNNLAHGAVAIPGWVITKSESIEGSMTFNLESLLSFGDWSERSRIYARSKVKGDTLDVIEPVEEYLALINKFYGEMRDLFARNRSAAERDYYEIEDQSRRWASQQFTKLFLQQVAKRNPYDYLHRFFSDEEVRQIRRYPDHSKEQVDYIIGLKLADTACDDELRARLYGMFGVTSP